MSSRLSIFSDLNVPCLPRQMYLRLGELPLYLSRSAVDGGFKRMKDGYFKTQAISPLVEEVQTQTQAVLI